MSNDNGSRRVFLLSICVLLLIISTEARYLPTRSNEDNLDRLRDLLRDILESDKPTAPHQKNLASLFGADSQIPFNYPPNLDHYGYPSKYLTKREASNDKYFLKTPYLTQTPYN